MGENASNETQSQLGKRFLNHSVIYGLAMVARALAGFALLPIYTQYLAPKDYGVIELLTMLIEFSAIFFGARIGQSFLRFYGLADSETERSRVLGSAYGMVAGTHVGGVLVLVLASTVLSRVLFGSEEYSHLVALFSLTLLFGGLLEIPLAFLRSESKAFHVLGFSLWKLFLQISLNLLFLVYLEMGVEGVAIASVSASFIGAVTITLIVLWYRRFTFSWALARQLLSFSAPIILAAVSMFAITYGDRYFIRINMDLDAVGVYALAYKFGFMLFALGWSPFQTMWDAERYKIYKTPHQHPVFEKVFSLVSVLVIYVALGISVWVDPVLRLMSDPAYWAAADIVPIILLGYVFLAWTSFLNMGLFVKAKTHYFGNITLVTAVFCLAAYAILIPIFGLFGAAIATTLTFFLRLLAIHRFSVREFNMGLRWYPPIMALCLAGALIVVKFYLIQFWWPSAVALILSLAFPVLAVMLGVVPLHRIRETARIVFKRRQHIAS
ncbi:oligosaccharide flippase family protein [Marinobacteraceae bacterium S3BR75-40.1]